MCVYLQVRSARKEWVKAQAAAHLARSIAAHTSNVLQGWSHVAALQKHHRSATATARALHLLCCVLASAQVLCTAGSQPSLFSMVLVCSNRHWLQHQHCFSKCAVHIVTLHQSCDISLCITCGKSNKGYTVNRPYG